MKINNNKNNNITPANTDICHYDFCNCENILDALIDFALDKKIEEVSYQEFEQQGTTEEIIQIIKTEENIKLCPLMTKIFKETKDYMGKK